MNLREKREMISRINKKLKSDKEPEKEEHDEESLAYKVKIKNKRRIKMEEMEKKV
jgi:hypothetical protein